MSRYIYIDADAFEVFGYNVPKEYDVESFGAGVACVLDKLDKQPTADVREVKHGEWISLHNGRYKCSCCGMDWKLIGSPEANGMYYCLNCGAKMEMEDEQIY